MWMGCSTLLGEIAALAAVPASNVKTIITLISYMSLPLIFSTSLVWMRTLRSLYYAGDRLINQVPVIDANANANTSTSTNTNANTNANTNIVKPDAQHEVSQQTETSVTIEENDFVEVSLTLAPHSWARRESIIPLTSADA
ncbi:hypothetical protein BC936DRAFT_145994 [Jimgerdemannia flammicorona]|uniref:Uncharacterized protein n=1 Tax=Jimgerdemannia flammicorona TaxID=994334 RepID=A0A433D8L3_9FUNG|nr:hypothetical protein BC936DRAFT_145994 [Jimgerdemannia flammicorona]